MFSKLFPYDEQLWNRQETFESRIIAYTPEVMMMEWSFPNAGQKTGGRFFCLDETNNG